MPSHLDPVLALEADESWEGIDVDQRRVDPGVRLAASLIDVRAAEALYRKTGMRLTEEGVVENPRLGLFLRLQGGKAAEVLDSLAQKTMERGYAVVFPEAYLREARRNDRLEVVSAEFYWKRPRERSTGNAFRKAIASLMGMEGIKRVSMPNPLQPTLEESLRDLELPKDRMVDGSRLTGKGVIVGVIDDGCAIAHPNFLVPGKLESRILYLWDQAAATPKPGADPYWSDPGNFPARELTKAAIGRALAAHVQGGRVREDALHEALAYPVAIASHGTHVLDIAAGNGQSLTGTEGVAADADIIFVQLPSQLVEEGGPLLESHILAGVQYIFDRAGNQPAVVNISYGGYSGPHDGTSDLAKGIDDLLAIDGRAVVVSAGNGFEADCHMQGTVAADGNLVPLKWLLSPEDPTTNQLEIWYDPPGRLEMVLMPPGANAGLHPAVGPGEWKVIRRQGDNGVVGWIAHHIGQNGGSNVIRIDLNATEGETTDSLKGQPGNAQQGIPPPPAFAAPAPSGRWLVGVRNKGGPPVAFHAWIARDDLRTRSGRRRQQSRFPEDEAEPRSSVADLATGRLAICVGAHNIATGEMCRYSACGPTRDGRRKPDVTATAEDTAAGGGVLCASSRRAQPSRFGGTSAAAPHVAGMVALTMQARADAGDAPLAAAQIRQAVIDGAATAKGKLPPPPRALSHNRGQEVDPHRPPGKKQSDHFAAVSGAGKANLPESMG